VTWRPLVDRLELLYDIVKPSDYINVVALVEDGEPLLQATVNLGLEGIVSKR
jgi:ATP-dependent DNA ligase